jgi:hypothetical protein
VIDGFFRWSNLDFLLGVKMQPHPNIRRPAKDCLRVRWQQSVSVEFPLN